MSVARLWLVMIILMLAGCGGDQDFDYNERVIAQFIAHRDQVQEVHRRIESGEFTYDFYSMKYRKMQRLSDAARDAMVAIDDIPHSAHANAFALALARYYETEALYYSRVKRYIRKTGNFDGVQMLKKINASYARLLQLSNQVQVTQLEFFEAAGLSATG